jgi:NADPH:quinone reductase-like Zn-dependent oxidoreductase
VCSSELGARITADVVDKVRAGRVRPVVGQVVPFEELPRAMDDMASRRTVGRTVVLP